MCSDLLLARPRRLLLEPVQPQHGLGVSHVGAHLTGTGSAQRLAAAPPYLEDDSLLGRGEEGPHPHQPHMSRSPPQPGPVTRCCLQRG